MDKDYKLAEHLIAHLQQDEVLAAMVCPTVWDDQDQVDAINRSAIGQPGAWPSRRPATCPSWRWASMRRWCACTPCWP